MRILVVDDNDDTRNFLEFALRESGCEVVTARGGREALGHLGEASFDIIISDILMPGMDGFQFCRECKKDPALGEIPFVFYSGTYMDEKDREFALSLGVDKYLMKPLRLDILLKEIEGIVKDKIERRPEVSSKGIEDESEFLAEHNKRLIKKLEDKIAELENLAGAFRESEEKYRALFEAVPVGIGLSTFEGKILAANRALMQMSGYSLEESLSASVSDIHVDLEKRREMLGILRNSGQVRDFEAPLKRKDGTIFYGLINLDEITLGGERVLLSTVRDITEQKRAKEALQQYTIRLEKLREIDRAVLAAGSVESIAGVAVQHLRSLLGCQRVSVARFDHKRRLASLLALDVEGEPLLGPAVDVPFNDLGIIPLLQSGKPFVSNDSELTAKLGQSGKVLQAEGIGSMASLPLIVNDQLIGSLNLASASPYTFTPEQIEEASEVATLLAITLQQARLREEIRLRADELRESEIKYRTIFENTGTATIIVEENTVISLANRESESLSGYTQEELKGNRSWTEFVMQDDLAKIEEYHRLRRIDPKAVPRNYEFHFVDRHGHVKNIFATIALIPGTGRSVVSMLDVTERKQAEDALKQSMERLRKASAGIIDAIVMAVETRDPYTAGHQKRVAYLARSIAGEMGLVAEQIDGIVMAGVIHDLGKISIPAEILSTPRKLTKLEFGLVQAHPETGYTILRDIEFPWPVADIVLQHHERLDGSGYPKGLKGEDTLLEARILAVADVVEAIASHRPYRPAFGIDIAIEEILRNKGLLYDAPVVDACIRLFREKGFEFE